MQVIRATAVLVAMGVFLTPTPVSAQSAFVTGTVFANIFKAGGYQSAVPVRQNDDLSGTSTGGALGAGTAIGPHVVVQAELMVPAPIERTFEPPEYLPPLRPPLQRTTREVEYRTRHGAVLAGYRTATRRRVAAAFLAGVMFLQEKTRTVATTVVPPPMQPLPSDSTTRAYRVAPVLGLDVEVLAVSRLSIVPQLRVHKVPGGLGAIGLWPGIGVRWTF